MLSGAAKLVDGSAELAVGHSPVGRILLLTITTLAAALSISGISETIGMWLVVVTVLVTIALVPAYGLALAIFAAPFQQIAGLGPAEFHLLDGIIWSAAAVRLVVIGRLSDVSHAMRSPTAVFLALFAFLVIFDNSLRFDSAYYWIDVGFVCSLTVIAAAIAIPNLLPPYLPRVIVIAAFAGGLMTIGFDVVFVYIPLPELSPHATSLPPDRLRLAGLHANPLASAKFILVVCCMLAASLIVPDQGRTRLRTVAMWSLFGIVAFALTATESKSSNLAFLISLVVITFAAYRIETITFKKVLPLIIVGLVFVATMFVWTLVLAGPVKRYAATAWLDSNYITESRPDLNELAGLNAPPNRSVSATSPGSGVVDRFKSELRIGQSFRLQAKTGDLDNPLKSQLSQETATRRDCGLMCTGQRDLLWKAGLEVIQEHWLAGIGFGAWKRVLDQKLGFPFDHPHNGFMELWGEFGIVGAAMYLSLVVFLVRRARSAIRMQAIGFEKWFLVGSSMAALAYLANELFDTTKFFSMSPHAIWIWSLLALQERYLRQPLTWSAPSWFISFLSGKVKHQPTAAPFARSNP